MEDQIKHDTKKKKKGMFEMEYKNPKHFTWVYVPIPLSNIYIYIYIYVFLRAENRTNCMLAFPASSPSRPWVGCCPDWTRA
jgi:hypothetical protein